MIEILKKDDWWRKLMSLASGSGCCSSNCLSRKESERGRDALCLGENEAGERERWKPKLEKDKRL